MRADEGKKVGSSRILVSILYAEILGFSDLADQLEPWNYQRLDEDLVG